MTPVPPDAATAGGAPLTRHRTFRVIATKTETFCVDLPARDECMAIQRAKKLWDGGMQGRFNRIMEAGPVVFEIDVHATGHLADVANEDRATWARKALQTFARETGSGMGQDALRDLLCDLAHYADSIGLDARCEMERAASIFADEAAAEVRS